MMDEYSRYAIYHAPTAGPLAAAAARWLGRDPAEARELQQPEVQGLDLARITSAPRKYGFHGTLKPPFRLAEGHDRAGLEAALGALGHRLSPVEMPGLRLARLGGFLALVPEGDTAPLAALAARVVEELDSFRAPPAPEELARRRAGGLTPRQDALLTRWGYPYVMEEFRFHLTLTGKLGEADASRAEAALSDHLAGTLPHPFRVDSLCLFGEATDDGRFRLLKRVPLTG